MKLPDRNWTIYVADADVDASAELVTTLATTYAQLAAADTLEVLSSEAADTTQTVTIYGIAGGKRVAVDVELNGTTAVDSGTTFTYYEGARLDKECAGTVTIRRATGDTFISSIAAGQLKQGEAQHFNGEMATYLQSWHAVNVAGTDEVILQLRWYPDDADCLDAGDGYEVIDDIQLTAAQMGSDPHLLYDKRLPPGGWLCVYATGASADESISVTVSGRDEYA